MAVQQYLTAGHIIKARDQVDDAALAAASSAEDSHRLARLSLEAHALEYRLAAAKVAKAHVRKLHSAFYRRQWDGAGLVGHLVVSVEDLIDAIGAGCGLTHLRDDESELAEGEENQDEVKAELLPFADGQGAVYDLLAAKVEHGRLPEVGDQEDHWEEEAENALHLDLLAHQVVG